MLAPVDVSEESQEIIQKLLAERSPEQLAAMLVQAHRARLPEPEDLTANTPEARRDAQKRTTSPRI